MQKNIVCGLIALLCAGSLTSCIYTRTVLKDIERPLKDLSEQPLRALKPASSLDLCFVKTRGGDINFVPVKRKAGVLRKSKLESAVRALLEGPTADEISEGLGSEIPRGTILLGMNERDGAIELNLSKRFASGAGVDSFETRMEQLARTVTSVVGNQPVFVNVEGKRLDMTPGDGLEVKQPINTCEAKRTINM